MKRLFFYLVLAFMPAGLLLGEDELTNQVKVAMDRSTAFIRSISTRGGYGGMYSLDLKTGYGEALHNILKPAEIWIQPPGTPSVGLALLRAYRITRDDSYLAAARDTGRALAWSQRAGGGWGYYGNVSDLKPDSQMPTRKQDFCTLDDRTTQGALDFLMNLNEYIDEPWLSESVQLGSDYILKAQFPNGAWPQQYPLRGGYLDYYTYNDEAFNDCISVMLTAHRLYNKEQYLHSARQGGDFIILSQQPGSQGGWAEQYSHDLKPAQGRVYEPPGISSHTTACTIETLVDLYLYTRDEKYLAPIPGAIAWLEKSKIGPNTWARLYEVGGNRPIYGDTDGKTHYRIDEISEERRRGYGWQGEFGVGNAIKYYQQVKQLGAERYLTLKFTSPSAEQHIEKAQKARKLIQALDKDGRWVRDNMIHSVDFVVNMNTLCGYLELDGSRAHDELLYWYCSGLLIKRPGKLFPYARRGMYPFEELEMAWRDEYNLPIGEPVGERYLLGKCWARDYKNAKVLVNPTDKIQHVSVDKGRQWLDWKNKKPVTELEMPPFTGGILLPI